MVRSLRNADKVALRNYQYAGADLSMTYKYVLSPLAQFCVDHFTPITMAPNVITFLGLCFPLFALACTLVYDPNLLSGPRWIYLNSGCCILIYQTLDNMDGKQARKTGSSSALGMLFDHGCDAINTTLSSITMASCLGTGWSPAMLFVCFCGYFPFFFETWEQSYVGGLYLPLVNGPSEGLIVAAVAFFMSYWNGPEWWHQETSIALPSALKAHMQSWDLAGVDREFFEPFDLIVFLIGSGVLATVISGCYHVIHKQQEKSESVMEAFCDLLPFLVSFGSQTYWIANSTVALQVHPVVTVSNVLTIYII